MGDLFGAVSGGFARFVFAWALPTLISVGLFCLFVWPDVITEEPVSGVAARAGSSGLASAIVFTFVVLTITVVLAYSQLAIYQLLEGYTLPSAVRRPLEKRHQRRHARLYALRQRWQATGELPSGFDLDSLLEYPSDVSSVRATRLGNALSAAEGWSRDRYYLDTQTMWYELLGVASEDVVRHTEEGRAPVDFFVSAIANAVLLAVTCLAVSFSLGSSSALVLAVVALSTTPLAYRLAVRNALDWNLAVKALVNLSRHDLAGKMGLRIDQRLEDERDMWRSHYWAVEANDDRPHIVQRYDGYRVPPTRNVTEPPAL